MAMMKLLLICWLVQFSIVNGDCKNGTDYNLSETVCEAYPPANVPFLTEDAAEAWVDIFCSSFARYLAVEDYSRIVECWGEMYTHPHLIFVVDDYEYKDWIEWSDEVTIARPYLVYLRVKRCAMTAWRSDSVVVAETVEVGFNITVSRPDIKRAELVSQVNMTFETQRGKKCGIFLSFIRVTADGGDTGKILAFFATIKHFFCKKVPAVISGFLPSAIVNHPNFVEFLEGMNVGMIMFLVVMVAGMYIALLFVVIRVCKMCIEKSGMCSKLVNFGKREEYAQVNFTTATEADDLQINNEIE